MPNFIQQLVQQAMKKKGGDLIAPVLNRSVGKLGPRDLPSRFTPTQPLRSFPGAPVQAPGLPSPPVRAVNAASKGVSPYAVVGGGLGLGAAFAATNQIEGALNQVGPALDQFFGRITPQAVQKFGREQEKKGWGGALEVAIPGRGFLAAPFIPNTQPSSKPSGTRPVGTQAVLNGKPVYWGGDNYGWQQLNQTGSSATLSSLNTPGSQGRFIQEQGFRPIGGTPAERAQAAETSRVAQLTAQDPELQRYEKARAAAKTQEEMNAARDIGMQMWAKANPQLAAKVKPGQSGYDVIQGTLAGNAARAGQGFNMAEQLTPTAQGFPTQIPAFPTGAGYSTGYGMDTNLAPGAQTPPPYSGIKTTSETPGTAATSSFSQPNVMNPEDFQKLLNMVRK